MDAIQTREAVTQFLALEAKLLDEGRFDEWFALLDDGLDYHVPIRQAANNRSDEVAGGYRMRDTKQIIGLRIERMKTGAGYAEMPPSRTVRSVSSIFITGQSGGIIGVSSALIVYRHRANDAEGDAIHARRNDQLRITADGLRLLSRTVLLAEVSMSTPNLGIFL